MKQRAALAARAIPAAAPPAITGSACPSPLVLAPCTRVHSKLKPRSNATAPQPSRQSFCVATMTAPHRRLLADEDVLMVRGPQRCSGFRKAGRALGALRRRTGLCTPRHRAPHRGGTCMRAARRCLAGAAPPRRTRLGSRRCTAAPQQLLLRTPDALQHALQRHAQPQHASATAAQHLPTPLPPFRRLPASCNAPSRTACSRIQLSRRAATCTSAPPLRRTWRAAPSTR